MSSMTNTYASAKLTEMLTEPMFLALFTADPTDTGSVANELADQYGYLRIDISNMFSAPVDGATANDSEIILSTAAGGDWGTVTHIGIMNSVTQGTDDMNFHQVLVEAIPVLDGETYIFTVGTLTIELD